MDAGREMGLWEGEFWNLIITVKVGPPGDKNQKPKNYPQSQINNLHYNNKY